MKQGLKAILPALLVMRYSCAAEASLRNDSVQSLPDIEVLGRQSEPGVVAPQTLHGEQLEKLNSHSVADALRYFSGVQIKDYGGVGGVKTIDIRSMGSHHTGVFYDGLQLGNAQNGQIDLGRYSLDNIESISLYKARYSSRHAILPQGRPYTYVLKHRNSHPDAATASQPDSAPVRSVWQTRY